VAARARSAPTRMAAARSGARAGAGVKRPGPRRSWVFQLALAWLVATAGCGALLNQLALLDGRIALEVDARDDVRKSTATDSLRDPGKWQSDQRRVNVRIDTLRRRRNVTLGLLLALGALVLVPVALAFRSPREKGKPTMIGRGRPNRVR
jgi:hypothetical protein